MDTSGNAPIYSLVHDTQRAISKSLDAALKPYDLTSGQWSLIKQLYLAGQLSQKELAQATKKEQATITRYLDTLERKKLVVRRQHKTDRRSHLVSLTDKACKLIVEITPLITNTANGLIEGIDPRDIDTLIATLKALKENADKVSVQE